MLEKLDEYVLCLVFSLEQRERAKDAVVVVGKQARVEARRRPRGEKIVERTLGEIKNLQPMPGIRLAIRCERVPVYI